MTNHPLTDRIPLTHYPYERIVVSPLDKACDDQRDAFQESISEAHKLGRKTGRDEQLEQVMEWLDKHLSNYSDAPWLGSCESILDLKDHLKKAMRPQEDDNA
jgi:hypothetical protein